MTIDANVAADSARLPKVLDYLAYVARPRPLGVLLDEATARIAEAIQADVASLYLLEGDGQTLVMRGNVGFPKRARGTVRLRVGEGLTGIAVAQQFPMSSTSAPGHACYRGFPELDEERFPAFVAVPILGTAGPLGAMVAQRRRHRPFSEDEICLLAALTTPISAAVRLARLLDDLRGGTKASGRVTLPAEPIVPGKAMGTVAALKRPLLGGGEATATDRKAFSAALDTAERGLDHLLAQAQSEQRDEDTAFLRSYRLMIEDQRLRRLTDAALAQGVSLSDALGELVGTAARSANEHGDAFLVDRARDFEQLCEALLALASPAARERLPSKAIVVTDRLSIFDLLLAAKVRPAGVALADDDPDPRTRRLLDLLGVPALIGVQGLFRWVAPGDVALLDADHGFLIANPTRAEVAALRAERRRHGRASQPGDS